MDFREKIDLNDEATSVLDNTDAECNKEDWHEQLLQLNRDVAMDFMDKNFEINNLETYCNAKEELLNDLKLQVTILEGEVNLKLQELNHLQEKEQLLNDNINTLNDMINSKEETEDILLENHRLLKSKRERHDNQRKQISNDYTKCLKEMRENYEKNPLAQKRRDLQIEVMKQRINLALLLQKVQDEKDSVRMMRDINKRREQIKIIRFAEVMVEYYEMQKMARQIRIYEKKFKEISEQKHKPREDIFKVPQYKSQPALNINKTTFEPPPLNLSAYQIKPETLLTSKVTNEDFKSRYSLNQSIDTMLSKLNTTVNKRSRQSFSPPKQKKLKTMIRKTEMMSSSLPLPVTAVTNVTNTETMKIPPSQEELFEYVSQEPVEILGKSPYFPYSGSGSNSISQNGDKLQNNTTMCLEVSEEDNEHELNIMETSSFASIEDFTSPPAPETSGSSGAEMNVAHAENTGRPVNNNAAFLNMFSVARAASSPQDKSNTGAAAGFSFLNTPSRKKSSQNIFTMF